MSTVLRKFVAKMGFEVDDGDLKKVDDGINKTIKGLQRAGQASVRLGQSLSLKVTAPIVLMGGAMIKAASDADEAASKFKTVFQDVESDANRAAKNLAQDFGLSKLAAKELLGDTGDLLSGFGFTGESALDLSNKVQKLAVDLASFTNFSGGAKGASAALTKALLGERESIKSLGIAIMEKDVQAEVSRLKAEGQTFASDRQAKAIATLNLAMKQSKNAIGDFARTNEGFANRTRILRARLSDLAVSFGTILLPPALKIVNTVASMVNWFEELSEGTKTAILVIGGLAAVIGPLLIVGGTMINTMLSLRAAVMLLGNGSLIAGLKMIAIPLLIAAAFGALFLIFEDISSFFSGKKSITGLIVDKVKIMADDVWKVMKGMGTQIKESLNTSFEEAGAFVQGFFAILLAPINAVISGIKGVSGAIGAIAGGGGLSEVGDALSSSFSDFASPFKNLFAGKNVSFTEVLGFGERNPASVNKIGNTTANNSSNSSVKIDSPINITVPANTPPEAVSGAVQSGIKDSLGALLRETNRNVVSAEAL